MNKVLVIGIDGLDPDLIMKWQGDLPSFRKIITEGYAGKLESVFPPDSVAAWATIFTGKTPAQHGIMEHISYLNGNNENFKIPNLKGTTFWDLASKEKMKVCIINPFLAYPVWPVNGVMISGPVFMKGDVQYYPHIELLNEDMPGIGGISDFPNKKNIDEFISKNIVDIKRLYRFSSEKFSSDNFDLCFVTFFQLDRIQHFLWRYTDPGDCTYPGPNKYSNSIKEFYKLIDSVIGHYFEDFDNNTTFVIISDHGHGRRCNKVLNINEILRQAGFMKSKVGRLKFFDSKYLLEKIKLGVLEMVYHLDLEDFMYAITKYIPNRKALKKSTFITDSESSLAYTSTFGGTNPFGGITINKKNVTKAGLDYETFRSNIIDTLNKFKDEKTGKHPFLWLKCREDIDNGPFITIYPDIVFELEESYGVNWALHTKVVGWNTTHKKISGGHKYHSFYGVLNSKLKSEKSPVKKISEIAPGILDILLNQ